MPSSHLILCCPILLLPPTPPSIRVFSNESTLRMRWPKYWSFSFSISPSSEHPGLIALFKSWHYLLRVCFNSFFVCVLYLFSLLAEKAEVIGPTTTSIQLLTAMWPSGGIIPQNSLTLSGNSSLRFRGGSDSKESVWMQETWVQSLGQKATLEKGIAAHSTILAWRIPWTEEPGGLQSMGSQRVGHKWAVNFHTFSPLLLMHTQNLALY